MSKHINNTEINGVLEIDHNRGIIYFHSVIDGFTVLRICKLTKIPKDVSFIDITQPEYYQIERRDKNV